MNPMAIGCGTGALLLTEKCLLGFITNGAMGQALHDARSVIFYAHDEQA
jgi:hypothetical protein